MYKLCKTVQSAQRQRELEKGLLKLMLVRPYEEIAVCDLCDSMNIPRKTFYRYFSGKEGALYALVDHTLMEYEGFNLVYASGERRSMEKELEQFFLFWREQRQLIEALFRSNLIAPMVQRAVTHAMEENLLPMRFLPENRPEERKYITMFCGAGLLSLVVMWHSENYQQSAKQMAKMAARMLGQPLFPNVDQMI